MGSGLPWRWASPQNGDAATTTHALWHHVFPKASAAGPKAHVLLQCGQPWGGSPMCPRCSSHNGATMGGLHPHSPTLPPGLQQGRPMPRPSDTDPGARPHFPAVSGSGADASPAQTPRGTASPNRAENPPNPHTDGAQPAGCHQLHVLIPMLSPPQSTAWPQQPPCPEHGATVPRSLQLRDSHQRSPKDEHPIPQQASYVGEGPHPRSDPTLGGILRFFPKCSTLRG